MLTFDEAKSLAEKIKQHIANQPRLPGQWSIEYTRPGILVVHYENPVSELTATGEGFGSMAEWEGFYEAVKQKEAKSSPREEIPDKVSDPIGELRQEIRWLQETILQRDKQLAEARALLEEIEQRLVFAEQDWPDIPLSNFLPYSDQWRANLRTFLHKQSG